MRVLSLSRAIAREQISLAIILLTGTNTWTRLQVVTCTRLEVVTWTRVQVVQMAIDSLCATLRGKPVWGDDRGGKDEAADVPQPLFISHSALSKCECRHAQAAACMCAVYVSAVYVSAAMHKCHISAALPKLPPCRPCCYWSYKICIHGARELSYPWCKRALSVTKPETLNRELSYSWCQRAGGRGKSSIDMYNNDVGKRFMK